jgi:hypothetical protein
MEQQFSAGKEHALLIAPCRVVAVVTAQDLRRNIAEKKERWLRKCHDKKLQQITMLSGSGKVGMGPCMVFSTIP